MIGLVIAQVDKLEDAASAAGQTLDSAILAEQFYFFTVVLMWLIHVGFMSYEAGVVRRKNVLATAMKNILTIAVVTPTFYYVGWWIYNCNQPGLPIGPNSTDFTAAACQGGIPWSRRLRPEPDQQHQPDLLPGLPAVLLDDRLDHVGCVPRADPPLGVSDPRVDPRLGRLDPRRSMGLERRRLDDAAVRLPRLDRLGRRAWHRGRVRARSALQPRSANREIHAGGSDPPVQTAEPAHNADRADAHLHGLLRLLRSLPRDRIDELPGLGEHLPQPDDARLDHHGDHVRLRWRLHGRLLRKPRRPVLDRLRWSRRRDRRVRRCRRIRADARLPAVDGNRRAHGLRRRLHREEDAR